MTRACRWLIIVPFLIVASPRPLTAQRSPAETMQRAVILYEELQLERAIVLLRQVVSTSAAGQASPEQRTQAHKYLGAAYALLRQRDSALVHFATALDRDPFLDLDARTFTEGERRLFLESRRSVFAVGARAPADTVITPGSEQVSWTVVTTQPATVQASLRPADGGADAALATLTTSANGEGLADMRWNGLTASGAVVPAGRYTMSFVAKRVGGGVTDSASLAVDIRYQHASLEDSLPALRADELLPERRPPSASRTQLAKGMGLAVAALAIPSLLGSKDLGTNSTHTAVMAGGSAAAGVAGFVLWGRSRIIATNVAANEHRRRERAVHNVAVARRNSERMAGVRLAIVAARGTEQ